MLSAGAAVFVTKETRRPSCMMTIVNTVRARPMRPCSPHATGTFPFTTILIARRIRNTTRQDTGGVGRSARHA